jgi:hypothetical protein
MTRQRVEKALSRAKRVDDARLNVLLSREMHRYLKLFSLEREMSISDVVREALLEYMSKYPKE